MANREQLKLLKAGVKGWNKWRKVNKKAAIDLRGADLGGTDLSGAHLSDATLLEANLSLADLSRADLSRVDLRAANLKGADLSGTNLFGAALLGADLSGANLSEADFMNASLIETNLRKANLHGVNLYWTDLHAANLRESNLTEAILVGADLRDAILTEANLSGADLMDAILIGADLRDAILIGADLSLADISRADLSGADLSKAILINSNLIGTNVNNVIISKSNIYGINVWDLKGEIADQKELIITPEGESTITVDNIEIAQFIYLILNNKKIRDAINTLTSKTVLILGRFSILERKTILDALRNKLREYDLLPIVFDFERPTDKDFTETIKTLAGISYFVIADVTNPKSSPLELQATVPDYQIPFVPIIQEGESPFAMMVDLQKKYNWVLPTRSYDSIETLMSALKPGIIDPAVEMRNKLRIIKAQEHPTESLKDYLDKTL